MNVKYVSRNVSILIFYFMKIAWIDIEVSFDIVECEAVLRE